MDRTGYPRPARRGRARLDAPHVPGRCAVLLFAVALAACSAAPGGSTPASTAGGAAGPSASPLPMGVSASIALDGTVAPNLVAIGDDAVWVASHRATTLYRIDPATNAFTRVDVGQEACLNLIVAFGRVWVPPCDDSTRVVAVDTTAKHEVGGFVGGSAASLDGSIWTTSATEAASGNIVRIDPQTLKVTATVHVGGSPAELATGGGFVWAVDEDFNSGRYGGAVAKIDPKKNSVVARFAVPDPGDDAFALYAFDALWLKGVEDGRLTRVDPGTGAAKTYTLPGFTRLSQDFDVSIAEGAGSLWVRIGDGSVARIDPATGTVTATFPADPSGGGGLIGVGFGALWIANFGSDTVWRDPIGT